MLFAGRLYHKCKAFLFIFKKMLLHCLPFLLDVLNSSATCIIAIMYHHMSNYSTSNIVYTKSF